MVKPYTEKEFLDQAKASRHPAQMPTPAPGRTVKAMFKIFTKGTKNYVQDITNKLVEVKRSISQCAQRGETEQA